MNLRLGRKCHLKSVNTKHRNIWKGCLSDSGPRLFNILPKNLRNTTNCSKLSFKLKLDRFLQDVPDEPLLQNYLCFRRADSNSLVEMVKHRTPRVGWVQCTKSISSNIGKLYRKKTYVWSKSIGRVGSSSIIESIFINPILSKVLITITSLVFHLSVFLLLDVECQSAGITFFFHDFFCSRRKFP